VAIQNHSTKNYVIYSSIIEEYRHKFTALEVKYLKYTISGFDIGSANNCSSVLLNSEAEYTWFLPDDDLAELDSLKIIHETIKQYQPCMIHGGRVNKKSYSYDQVSVSLDDFVSNEVCQIVSKDKVLNFFSDNVVQAQEMVFRSDLIKPITRENGNIKHINEMFPAFFSVFVLQDKARPLVFLKNSIGIFRDGEPNSSWRNRWLSLSLETWPQTLEYCLSKEFITPSELELGKKIFKGGFSSIEHRPDILLGMSRKFPMRPWIIIRHYPREILSILMLSPLKIILKVYEKIIELLKK